MSAFPICTITVGERHRRDMGDLQGLAASIAEIGLLQPIGVSPSGTLVFGDRRLRACRDILGWTEIPARVVDVPSIVRGEHDENVIRKDFTPSERVAIFDTLATNGHGGDRKSDQAQNFALDRDDAARLAGFGNRETARQARAVVERGIPELVAAMDDGKVAISTAANLAREPEERQRQALVAIERRRTLQVMGSSVGDEWYTPKHVVDMAVEMLGAIDTDPAWHPDSPIKARTTYTIQDDGLAHEWHGRTWLNPPYGDALPVWIGRLVDEYTAGRVTEALALIPARVDTRWFALLDPFPRCFVYGRLVFANSQNPTPFPCCIPYLGQNVERFAKVFGAIGGIWVRLEEAA